MKDEWFWYHIEYNDDGDDDGKKEREGKGRKREGPLKGEASSLGNERKKKMRPLLFFNETGESKKTFRPSRRLRIRMNDLNNEADEECIWMMIMTMIWGNDWDREIKIFWESESWTNFFLWRKRSWKPHTDWWSRQWFTQLNHLSSGVSRRWWWCFVFLESLLPSSQCLLLMALSFGRKWDVLFKTTEETTEETRAADSFDKLIYDVLRMRGKDNHFPFFSFCFYDESDGKRSSLLFNDVLRRISCPGMTNVLRNDCRCLMTFVAVVGNHLSVSF